MTKPTDADPTPTQPSTTNPVPGRASWGGSSTSAESTPEGAEEDLHRGAQVLGASTEGGSKPEEERKPTRRPRERPARQRPRKPPEKKRRHLRTTRFNDAEIALLASAAAQCNLTVGGFLARSALAAARDLDRTSIEIADERDVITALFESRRRLGWAGSNLNQAVRALNSGTEAPHLEMTIAAVRRAADTVHDAAARLIERQSS
ncbi:hypothetical protein ACIO3O_34850 [Streptomyces sp. NPDC087440]|uniref:hypothetical protein n=1 Tax=Streptomyces sp. NPDC087440 TaxID=3365790 RepID=UPI00380AA67E